MARKALVMSALLGSALLSTPAFADSPKWNGLFDAEARREVLKEREMAPIAEACRARATDIKLQKLKPVDRLSPTEGYGSDHAAQDFSMATMVLAGRALAGDKKAEASLTSLLLKWADAHAFEATEESYDPYYALKRTLLPLAVAYQILQPSLTEEDATKLRNWIDPLVRRVDATFDREVDQNNHRVLADAVLAVWGSVIGDQALMQKGFDRYAKVMDEMRPDGTLELEARRGARALWYQRQTLSSLAMIAEVARGQGKNLYEQTTEDGRGFATLVGALVNGIASPILVYAYSSENHIPGPEKNYLDIDLSFLETRGHDRHYMAWVEAAIADNEGLSFDRLRNLFARRIKADRPLIDEFAGGNATCFWGKP